VTVPGPTVGVGVTVPVGVPDARARAVAVTQAALTVLAALLPAATTVPLTVVDAAFTVGATWVAALATLLPAALTVGARLVARPVMLLAAELTVGAMLVAAPDALLAAAFTVGAILVAAPVTAVAAVLTVAVALELLHAASRGSAPSSKSAQHRAMFQRGLVISFSFMCAASPTIRVSVRTTDANMPMPPVGMLSILPCASASRLAATEGKVAGRLPARREGWRLSKGHIPHLCVRK
jgi:hypothetical protein